MGINEPVEALHRNEGETLPGIQPFTASFDGLQLLNNKGNTAF